MNQVTMNLMERRAATMKTVIHPSKAEKEGQRMITPGETLSANTARKPIFPIQLYTLI